MVGSFLTSKSERIAGERQPTEGAAWIYSADDHLHPTYRLERVEVDLQKVRLDLLDFVGRKCNSRPSIAIKTFNFDSLIEQFIAPKLLYQGTIDYDEFKHCNQIAVHAFQPTIDENHRRAFYPVDPISHCTIDFSTIQVSNLHLFADFDLLKHGFDAGNWWDASAFEAFTKSLFDWHVRTDKSEAHVTWTDVLTNLSALCRPHRRTLL